MCRKKIHNLFLKTGVTLNVMQHVCYLPVLLTIERSKRVKNILKAAAICPLYDPIFNTHINNYTHLATAVKASSTFRPDLALVSIKGTPNSCRVKSIECSLYLVNISVTELVFCVVKLWKYLNFNFCIFSFLKLFQQNLAQFAGLYLSKLLTIFSLHHPVMSGISLNRQKGFTFTNLILKSISHKGHVQHRHAKLWLTETEGVICFKVERLFGSLVKLSWNISFRVFSTFQSFF